MLSFNSTLKMLQKVNANEYNVDIYQVKQAKQWCV